MLLALKPVCSEGIKVARMARVGSEEAEMMRSEWYGRRLTMQGLWAWVGLSFSFSEVRSLWKVRAEGWQVQISLPKGHPGCCLESSPRGQGWHQGDQFGNACSDPGEA